MSAVASAATVAARRAWLERAEGLSREMLAAAGVGDWDRVRELDRQRRPLVEEAFAGALDDEARRTLEPALRRLAHLNEALLARAAEARDERGSAARSAGEGRRAVAAYQASVG